MAWEAFNGSMNAGETQYWWYTFGSDQGVQLALANPFGYNAQLISSNYGKQRNSDGSVTYYVTVTNNGPEPVTFDLQGGGVS